jgi:hypothetical protein
MSDDQQKALSPERIREQAAALKAGFLQSDQWAEVDDLLLDDRLAEAAQLLAQQTAPASIYPAVPRPREQVAA